MSAPFALYVGVDIAAKTFTASWMHHQATPSKALTFAQTSDGFVALEQQLAQTGIAAANTLLVLEATSSYWVSLAVAMQQAGFAVSVLNPGQVALFARSLPRRSKTDALDAQLLARFACERNPPRWTPPEQVYHELRQRLVVRDGLLHMRTQARNQRHAIAQWPVHIAGALAALDTTIAQLTAQVAQLKSEIASVLADGAWAGSATILASVPGVGLVTTAWLLVGTLNFSIAASPEQLTAYVGLAPLQRESGASVRGRAQIGHGGNGRLRTALYLATVSAARYNPTIKAFYERLRQAGKPMKVARCAAARKLLHLAWALIRKQQLFDANHGRTPGAEKAEVSSAEAACFC